MYKSVISFLVQLSIKFEEKRIPTFPEVRWSEGAIKNYFYIVIQIVT